MRALLCKPFFSMATVVLLGLVQPGSGHCDLYIQFLVDRSGSMWSVFGSTPKVLQVEKAINRVNEQLPSDVAIGLRVYPPPDVGPGGADRGLRIPLSKETRDRFPAELRRMNPRGKASLREHLKKALSDFPEGKDTKLLVLLCDGADTKGVSFCEKEVRAERPEGLRFYVLPLDVNDPAQREEFDCLSKQLDGKTIHLKPRDSVVTTLLPICRISHQDEVDRQRRVAEEQRRIQELLSKTRLKVEFQNTLDPFFADSVKVVQCTLNEEDVPIASSVQLAQGEGFLLFDKAMAQGTHQLSLRYEKWKDGKTVSSIEGVLEVPVEEGKISHVQCYPRGALFHWDFSFKVRSF